MTWRRQRGTIRCAATAVLCMTGLAGLAGLAGGCGIEDRAPDPHLYPTTGLYTLDSGVGASDPTDFPSVTALGQRCKPPFEVAPDAGVVGTEGRLQVVYQSMTYDARYAPRNCTAAWIETEAGEFVATIELRCAIRQGEGLLFYMDRTCVDQPGPDIFTSATLRNHMITHDVRWNGVDLDGTLVPDGNYKVMIEVSENDAESFLSEFPFVKGPEGFMIEAGINAGDPLMSVTLTWEPGGAP